MNDTIIEKTVRISDPNSGHKDLIAYVTDAYAAMPIRIVRGEHTVHMRWSEWREVADHVELCIGLRPEPAVSDPDPAVPYIPCGHGGLSPFGRCVLVADHDSEQHCDMRGGRW